ncbi:hypothetical protein O6H91_01G126100 [Diphasiastrum complanatum]|uniref:Uncharacterized protein n=2 Tax=Diphasiastrum complanatum TaxID=34168 RepID=A0ACC2EW15_DIPCM|nr:hypothetical protein O6H91_01G016000 [Diphasiastrum complanatum]KAJ7570565.1 hypothetical protein O6H91_01G126100 [Diphasiastrum complanatum]
MHPKRNISGQRWCHVRSKSEGDFSSFLSEVEVLYPKRRSINHNRFGDQIHKSQPQLSHSEKVGECVAGMSADCAAICCCPFTLLHVLGLIFVKVPATVARKIVSDLKKSFKKRKICVDSEEGEEDAESLTRNWSYKNCFKGEEVLQSSAELPDQEFLREYFHCKELGFGHQGLFETATER